MLAIVPAYSYAVSYDCNKAFSYVEKEICVYSDLSDLDTKLSLIYNDYIKESVDLNIPTTSLNQIKDEQRAWLKNRDNCNSKKCIEEIYYKRINKLCLSKAVGYKIPECSNNPNNNSIKTVIYYASEKPPTSNAPAEAPLCYKFEVANIQEQLQKLINKYPNLYDYKITKSINNSEILEAKRKDESEKIIDYFYSTNPDLCMAYVKNKNYLSGQGTQIKNEIENKPIAYNPVRLESPDLKAGGQRELPYLESNNQYSGPGYPSKTTESSRSREIEIGKNNNQKRTYGELQPYVEAIARHITQRWIRPTGSPHDLSATVEIQVSSIGEVIPDSVRIIQTSGDLSFDRSIIAAVYQASPLPVPYGDKFDRFRILNLVFSPSNITREIYSQPYDKSATENKIEKPEKINKEETLTKTEPKEKISSGNAWQEMLFWLFIVGIFVIGIHLARKEMQKQKNLRTLPRKCPKCSDEAYYFQHEWDEPKGVRHVRNPFDDWKKTTEEEFGVHHMLFKCSKCGYERDEPYSY